MSDESGTKSYAWDFNVVSESGEENRFYLQDELGSTLRFIDTDGAMVDSYGYEEFGNDLYGNQGREQPFGFTGEYYDLETNTYYLRHRYMNPTAGRFLSEDPIRDELNWYTYVGNDPINYIDPWGLERIVVSGGRYSTGSGFQYEFIETAIKQLYEWLYSGSKECIAWIIADEGWSKSDKNMFSKIANNNGITLLYITDKKQLFDYGQKIALKVTLLFVFWLFCWNAEWNFC
jgi:RHS repeat-associated protein